MILLCTCFKISTATLLCIGQNCALQTKNVVSSAAHTGLGIASLGVVRAEVTSFMFAVLTSCWLIIIY